MASNPALRPTKPSATRQLHRLLKVAGPWSYLLYLSAVTGLIYSIIGVAAADLMSRLTNSMLAGNLAAFTALLLPNVLLRLGETILSSLQHYTNGRFGEETTERLRQGAANRLSRATATASKDHSGQTLSRLTNDLGSTQNLLQKSIPSVFTGAAQTVLALGYMLWKHWGLALVAVFGAPAVFGIMSFLNKPVMSLSRQGQETLAKANETLTESLSGSEMVRSFGLQNRMLATFTRQTETWLGIMKRYSRLTSFAASIGFGASFTPFVLVFGIGGFMVLRGQIQMGMLLAFMDLLGYVSFPMGELPRLLTQMATESASAERVFDLMDITVERETGRGFAPSPSHPDIEFKDVTFTYPGASTPALSSVSFVIEHSKTVALAGPSGSGKSTAFRLLLGDYDPDSGEILVFGHSLDEWSLPLLRSHFSSVSQETYLFPFSVAENLRLEITDMDDEHLVEAARLAQADSFVRSLPQGYDTPVGELGNRVSGGEKQRLSLARALLRPRRVLLLDEATSALDYHSERQVIDGLSDARSGVTALIIAHRLSSVQNADRILVFDGGRLVEIGSHDELIEKKGRYCDLYSTQQRDRQEDTSPSLDQLHVCPERGGR